MCIRDSLHGRQGRPDVRSKRGRAKIQLRGNLSAITAIPGIEAWLDAGNGFEEYGGTDCLRRAENCMALCKSMAQSGGVTDGDRTRDIRSHNPVLYQLSYGHH